METTAEVIAETNPVSGPLLEECRIFTGYDPLRDQTVSGADRTNQALWTFGTIGLGAVLSKTFRHGGRLLWVDDAADLAADLRKVDLVEQLKHTPEDAHFLLNYAMGKTVGTGRAAHHIIPLEAIEELPELMQKAARGGFDINGCNNGFALLAEYHRTSHPKYNQFAFEALRSINHQGLTDLQVAAEVQKLADKASEWLSRRRSPLE